jgi:hypothetical protein
MSLSYYRIIKTKKSIHEIFKTWNFSGPRKPSTKVADESSVDESNLAIRRHTIPLQYMNLIE